MAGLYIVYSFTGKWATCALASLLCLLCYGLYGRPYVGINDPQMLAHALVLAGVWLFFKRPAPAWLGLFVPALAICCGLFIKHSAVVFPAAITAVLLFFERRRFWPWIALLGGIGAVLVAVSVGLHGRYMLAHMLSAHIFDIRKSLF